MSIEVKIPEVGESVSEALITQWLKQVGDAVEVDEPIVELETDKVTVELPSPAAGRLSEIKLGDGETAQVGDVIALIEEGAAGDSSEDRDSDEAEDSDEDSDEESDAEQASETAEEGESEEPEEDSAPEVREEDEEEEKPAATAEPDGERGEHAVRVMPAAQRALDEHGLQASDVQPSGPGGRLLKEDVERHVKRTEKAESASAKRERSKSKVPSELAGERLEEAVPMTPIRRRIAQRLVAAQENAALLTTFNEIDMTSVKELRSRYKDAFEKQHGVKLGFMSFFVKAVVDGLGQFPQINAEIRDEDIIYRNYYDIGIAVSTPRGLMVPVLRSAERLSFSEIELGIGDFADRAREGKIQIDELQGGTFTITNGGIFGSMMSTPIINPPQSGVLGLHAIQDRPVAIDGEVVIRPMMYVALTYDHRVVDGREAVTFLRRIKETIEEPSRILLEV